MSRIVVNLVEGSHAIEIEVGLVGELGARIAAITPHARALLALDAAIAPTHGRRAAQSLRAAGYQVEIVELIADERHKTVETVHRLYAAMVGADIDRSSPVVALGGGVVTDVAGYAAATYLRGVPLVHVPTTLLAMVDAAIGGKTGVNWLVPEGGSSVLAKNLIGSFYQPRAVLIDPEVLRTLPARELRCGIAESVKHAIIAEPGLLELLDRRAEAILDLDADVIGDLIERSARVKVAIVEADVREAGRRMALNLGHTFAHAIEPLSELDLRHGEAVSIGLCAALHCAEILGRGDADLTRAVRALLERFGLPVRLPRPVAPSRLIDLMAYDKKRAAGGLRLVLPTGPGAVEVVDGVAVAALEAAWTAVGAVPDR